ncbi:MAG: hypothetical protein GF370_03350, partial [Candidatus Nealsonbacteria bacterium]|nr:hypothetical protein [Candidatus Nealsonbacteria bacterium]
MSSKWPSKKQWGQFLRVLSKKEKVLFFTFLFLFLGSSFVLARELYLNNTEVVPAQGGTHIEGVVGSPRFINPLYAPSSDVDRDLAELIFSGLLKYDSEGRIQPDLAEKYEILEDGKVYEFHLKDNLRWHDSQPLTADDVIFTVNSIQNADVKSPLRPQWLGVEVERVSDSVVRFRLQDKSAVFLENCTLKILPQHIWGNISIKNFSLSPRNLKDPVGSGPFKLESLSQNEKGEIVSIELTRNPLYFDRPPYLSQITFRFFETEKQLLTAYSQGQIKGFSLSSFNSSPDCLSSSNLEDRCKLYSFTIPRYFGIFFNTEESDLLEQEEVRTALNYGTDKKEILNALFSGQGQIVNSPILPGIYGFESPTTTYEFDPKKAGEILEEAGFLFPNPESTVRVKTVEKERSFSFQSNLSVGSQGAEVRELQKCLANPPVGGPEIYPGGSVTGYFGLQTKAAVSRFQEKYYEEVLAPFG